MSTLRTVHWIRGVNVNLSVRSAHLEVLSRDLAHIAHDIQNHLATINESAGWMADLLKLKGKKKFGWIRYFWGCMRCTHPPQRNRQRLLADLNSIQEKVTEASFLTRRLGSFAHRLKNTQSAFLSNEALEEIRHVLLRKAKEKEIDLDIRLAEPSILIETDPNGFQLAVFCNVTQVMDRLKTGNRLILETVNKPGRFEVRLTSPLPDKSRSDLTEGHQDATFAHGIVEELGGQSWEDFTDGNSVTTLSFRLPVGKT